MYNSDEVIIPSPSSFCPSPPDLPGPFPGRSRLIGKGRTLEDWDIGRWGCLEYLGMDRLDL